jgi:hypothetical protein
LVTKGHKNTNAPLILKIWEIIFCFWANYFMGHFSGYFEGASTFLTPKLKSLGPLKISLEMAQKAICPQKKIISRMFKISGALIVKTESSLPPVNT